MSTTESGSQVIAFTSGLTPEVVTLTAVNVAIGACVAWAGWHANQVWPGRGRGDVFEYVGLALVVISVAAPLLRLGQTIRLSENGLTYKHRSKTTQIAWAAMSVFQTSPPGRAWFRRALVGDDKKLVIVDSQSFKSYDSFVKLATEIRKRNRPFD